MAPSQEGSQSQGTHPFLGNSTNQSTGHCRGALCSGDVSVLINELAI